MMNPDDPLVALMLAAVLTGGTRPDLGQLPEPRGPEFGGPDAPQDDGVMSGIDALLQGYGDYRDRQTAQADPRAAAAARVAAMPVPQLPFSAPWFAAPVVPAQAPPPQAGPEMFRLGPTADFFAPTVAPQPAPRPVTGLWNAL